MDVEKLKKLYDNLPKKGDFSEKTGINYSYIKKIISGKNNPSVKTLEKIADYFQVPVSYFFDEEESSKCSYTDEQINATIAENKMLHERVDELKDRVKEQSKTISILSDIIERGGREKRQDEEFSGAEKIS